MAIKTFTTGQVLTSADTNTYLANSGLVFISQTTVAAALTNVANCFSSTYDNYRVVWNIAANTGAPDMGITMSNGGTPVTTATYASTRIYNGAGANSIGSTSDVAQTFAQCATLNTSTNMAHGTIDFFSPFVARPTSFAGQSMMYNFQSTNYAFFQQWAGSQSGSTSFDGFAMSSGSVMTGIITVYGYRKV